MKWSRNNVSRDCERCVTHLVRFVLWSWAHQRKRALWDCVSCDYCVTVNAVTGVTASCIAWLTWSGWCCRRRAPLPRRARRRPRSCCAPGWALPAACCASVATPAAWRRPWWCCCCWTRDKQSISPLHSQVQNVHSPSLLKGKVPVA